MPSLIAGKTFNFIKIFIKKKLPNWNLYIKTDLFWDNPEMTNNQKFTQKIIFVKYSF